MDLLGITLVGVVLCTIALIIIIKKQLHICGPNEVLIFSGAQRYVGDRKVGYKAVKGGREFKVPMLEAVDRMDLTNMVISVSVKGAFSKGGIPLNVDGVANVKIGGDEPLLGNAVERLLGKLRAEVINIAKETLEGNLRGVLATMTPEEVNSDKIRFAKELMDEADRDLHALGLELDTLKIQNVSDERGYLDSIGRISGALVRKQATIAEATNHAASVIKDAKNVEEAELVSIDAAIRTLEAETKRKVADAETQQAAFVAEQRGEIQAAIAEAQAQMEVEKARIERTRQQLEADIVAPASAKMQAQINDARGQAAKIVEEGKATAQVLEQITGAWKAAGPNARDVFLMQKLQNLVETLTSTVDGVKVDKVTVLGSTAGGNGDLAQKVIGASEQIKAALGVDVLGALQGKMQGTSSTTAPASAPIAAPAPTAAPASASRRAAPAPQPAPRPTVPGSQRPQGRPAAKPSYTPRPKDK
ncbi:MAG: flotillin family protein [Proteobacteria bacterium]|nr:MAG: flotillin family protein [Pseudomonadota bacterium]